MAGWVTRPWTAGRVRWGLLSGTLHIDVYPMTWNHTTTNTVRFDMDTITGQGPIEPVVSMEGSDEVTVRFDLPAGARITDATFDMTWSPSGTGALYMHMSLGAERSPLDAVLFRFDEVPVPGTSGSVSMSEPASDPGEFGAVPIDGALYVYAQAANFTGVTATVGGHLSIDWEM